jgi:hypothetical protein
MTQENHGNMAVTPAEDQDHLNKSLKQVGE